jgi:deoxyribonuclease-4
MDGLDDPSKVAVCLDTAHTFEAGYDIKSEKGFKKTFKEFDDILGLDLIKVVHFNDSLSSLGSHADRHEHLGKGEIGLAGLSRVINHPKLKNAAFVMETPKDSDKDDLRNMAIARKMVGGRN